MGSLRPFVLQAFSSFSAGTGRQFEEAWELSLTKETETQLGLMSPSTIDRMLRHGFSTTKPGTLLKNAIPVRMFADWNENKPGFMEVDLVAYCGDSAGGYYLNHTVHCRCGYGLV